MRQSVCRAAATGQTGAPSFTFPSGGRGPPLASAQPDDGFTTKCLGSSSSSTTGPVEIAEHHFECSTQTDDPRFNSHV